MLPDGWRLREPADDFERTGLEPTTMGDLRELIVDGEKPAPGTRFLLTVVQHGTEVQKVAEYVGGLTDPEPDEPEQQEERPPLAAVPDAPGMSDEKAYAKAHYLSEPMGKVSANLWWLGIMVGAARTPIDYALVLRDARDVRDAADELVARIAEIARAEVGEVPDLPAEPIEFSGFTIEKRDRAYEVTIPTDRGNLVFKVGAPEFTTQETKSAYENLVALLAVAVKDRIADGDDPAEAAKQERTLFAQRVSDSGLLAGAT